MTVMLLNLKENNMYRFFFGQSRDNNIYAQMRRDKKSGETYMYGNSINKQNEATESQEFRNNANIVSQTVEKFPDGSEKVTTTYSRR
jgi:hypothetical protein